MASSEEEPAEEEPVASVQPIQPVWLGPQPQGIPKARGGRPEFEPRVIVSESSSSSSRRASVSDSAASASSSQVQHQDPQCSTCSGIARIIATSPDVTRRHPTSP